MLIDLETIHHLFIVNVNLQHVKCEFRYLVLTYSFEPIFTQAASDPPLLAFFLLLYNSSFSLSYMSTDTNTSKRVQIHNY